MTLSPRVVKVFLILATIGILSLIAMYEALLVGVVQLPSKIARVAHSNEDLQQAVKTARGMLPAFKYRLEHPHPGDLFAIKASFETAQGPEYIWLKDPVLSKTGFTAVVDQVPIAAKVQKGQMIEVPDQSVVDWVIQQSDGSKAGGFTDAALGSPVD